MGHPVKNFTVSSVFCTYNKSFIAYATIHQRDDGAGSILYIGKPVCSIHVPGKFPVSSFKETTTGVIPVAIAKQCSRVYDQRGKAFTHAAPDFHFSIIFT